MVVGVVVGVVSWVVLLLLLLLLVWLLWMLVFCYGCCCGFKTGVRLFDTLGGNHQLLVGMLVLLSPSSNINKTSREYS